MSQLLPRKRQLRKPEIMSPAGYWPQLRAAIEAGADAVYFGLKHFSARAKVGFDVEELPEVMATLHGRGVRGYITFNTLIFEHEIREAAAKIAELAAVGVDALIIQDLGIAKLAKQIAPGLELHASTQMSITNAEGVKFAQSLGMDRVTLARELSLEEIRSILAETDCELEMFVHGALCVAYSGQCFSSEAWGGRSANRGQCAQACRLPYQMLVDGALQPLADLRYLLSPGDLYALHQVPEIARMGMSALKIEGRYKDAEYVALTTSAYRRAVDEAWDSRDLSVTRLQELQLEQVYSRGLGAFFLNGTDHQAVVNGRAPRHRGVLLGAVVSVDGDGVVIQPAVAQSIAPVKPGDGLVFDAADWRSPQETEEGGRVYEVEQRRGSRVLLRFGNGAIRLERIRPGDLVWRTHDPDLDRVTKPYTQAGAPVAKQPVTVRVKARAGERLTSEWFLTHRPEWSVVVVSETVLSAAENRGITEDSLQSQFGRLGNTPYALAEVKLDVEGQLFAPVSVLNQMRRDAVEALQALQRKQRFLEVRDPQITPSAPLQMATPAMVTAGVQIHLLVRTPEQLDAAIELRPASITLDYLDLYGLRPSVLRIQACGLQARVASPRVLKPGEWRILDFLLSFQCPILVRGSGMLQSLREGQHPNLIGDFSLNTANSLTAGLLVQSGLARITPTHDLNAAQIAELAQLIGTERIEAIAFQHLPVFHTEHCVFCRFLSSGKSYRDCGRPCEKHRVELQDESGRAHAVVADVGCRNTVFGAEAQEASAHLGDWRRSGIRHFRLEFVHESAVDILRITNAFSSAFAGRITFSQLGHELRRMTAKGTTEGSLFVPKDFRLLPILQ